MRAETVRVLPMEERHLDVVAELERRCFSQPWSREVLQEELESAHTHWFVAEGADGAVLGYLGCRFVADEGEITNVAVSPECRSGGIGGLLVGRAMALAAERGVSAVWLEVRISNYAAIHLYEKHGFRIVGRRRGYYQEPDEDAYVMVSKNA